MQAYLPTLRNALTSTKTILLSAHCSIDYDGRAQTYLPSGDRIILIKADKTLLVHQPNGSAPVNYMKEGAQHRLVLDGGIFLESHHPALKESMRIALHKIYFLQTLLLHDGERIHLKGSERDMAEKIYNNPELIEDGFTPLSREEHTAYGFIDVFGYDKKNILVLVECKRYKGDLSAVTQLRRYVEKIKKSKGLSHVRGILACPQISDNAKAMLEDWGFEYRQISPPHYLEKHQKPQRKLGEFRP